MSNRAAAVRILGCGALTGAGRGEECFWEALRAVQPLQAVHDLGDRRLSEARFVAVPERETQGEPAHALLQLACDDALRAAGPALGGAKNSRIALFTGTSLGGMPFAEARHRRLWDPHGEAGPGVTSDHLPAWRGDYDAPAAALSRQLALGSGGFTINTACSSAANALGLARRWLLHRRIDVALVAGFDVISPFVYSGFVSLGAVDPEPSTPFGAKRHGLNLGEAAVAMVLARPEEVPPLEAPVDLIGYGSSCDAHHLTRPDLGGAGLARAVRAALSDAGVEARQIGLLSAHGTGTSYNDKMEAAAFGTAFGTAFGGAMPPMHCAKPVVGHTLGAAGAVDALAVWLMLRHQELPPTYLRGEEDPELCCHPERSSRPLAADTIALSTSSGFGGSNAALVMRRGDT